MTKTMIELFCGTKGMSEAFRARGFEVFTVDLEPAFEPTMAQDVGTLRVEDFPDRFRHPTVVWASPPCTYFSVASLSRYWVHGIHPRNDATRAAIDLVKKTIRLIGELNPDLWFIENPQGMLRLQPFMKRLPRRLVTYCKYGAKYRKPTDIWTNSLWWPIAPCHNGDRCHVSSPRGSRHGIQGLGSAKDRGKIPTGLCKEIAAFCDGRIRVSQTRLVGP